MQSSKLYVGNLDYSATTEEVTALFSTYGQVIQVNIIEGRGFGFVEMSSQTEAEEAKSALHNTEFKGRNLKIDEARPQKERPAGGGRGRDNRRDNRRRDQSRDRRRY